MKSIICSCLFLFSLSAASQMKHFGFHLGYGSSKLNIDSQNKTNFHESDAISAYYAGFFYSKSPSKGQRSNKSFLVPGISFELGLSKSGGTFLLERKNRNGMHFEQFDYQTYRMELGVLPELHYSGFKLFLGPALYAPLYASRHRESKEDDEHNLREYQGGTLALIAGIGYKYSIFSLDIRYQNTLTLYGRKFKDQPFEFSERLWKLTAGVRIFKTNREKNNDSIFWE